MTPLTFLLASTLLALSLSLAASALPSTPVFRNGSSSLPLTQGWLGADASYTIELSPNRYLWLFDDTMVAAELNDTDRRSAYWIHNTAGLMTCSGAGELTDCDLTYYWSDEERKSEFWLTGHEHDAQPQFYWVSDCFIHNSTLYVFLNTVMNVPWGLNFQVISSGIVAVDNYHDDLPHWRKRYQLIANTNVSIPGQTAILSTGPAGNPFPADPEGAAYLYSHMYISSPEFSITALVRFPLHRLHDMAFASGHWQYLATNLSFVPYRSDPTLPPADVQHFWPVVGTVRWHAAYKQWINVSPSPDCYFGGAPVYSVRATGWRRAGVSTACCIRRLRPTSLTRATTVTPGATPCSSTPSW